MISLRKRYMASGKHALGGTCILKGTGLKGCAPRRRGALRRETTRGSSPGGTLADQDDLKEDTSQGGRGGDTTREDLSVGQKPPGGHAPEKGTHTSGVPKR